MRREAPAAQPTIGVPYLPSVHARSLGEFCAMLNDTPPTRAKRIDTEGGLVVTTETRRIYFAATRHALRALRHYRVEVDA